jgi:hypothetical protein
MLCTLCDKSKYIEYVSACVFVFVFLCLCLQVPIGFLSSYIVFSPISLSAKSDDFRLGSCFL